MKELLEERIKTYKKELEGLDKEQYERHIAVISELEHLLNQLEGKEYTRYLVEEANLQGTLFVGSKNECMDFVKTELLERNNRDGYDEYWHNAHIVIVKEINLQQIVVEYNRR